MVGTQIIELSGIENGITIDSELEEAYYGDALKNDQMTGEFPVPGSGKTAVSRTGNVNSVSMIPGRVSL